MDEKDSGHAHARIPGEDPTWLKPALAVVFALIVLIIVLVTVNNDDGGSTVAADAEPVSTTTVVPLTSSEQCALDLRNLVEFATRPGATQDSAMADILTMYGADDGRTQFVVQVYGTLQSEVYQLGQAEASANFHNRIADWCDQNGPTFYD